MKTKSSSKLVRNMAVAVAAITGTLTLATSTPASAATSIGFCNGVPGAPVMLTYWNQNAQDWSFYRHGRSGANGCGTFWNTPSNVFFRVETTYKTSDGWLWKGETGYAPRGQFGFHVGSITWTKLCQQCSAD